MASSNRRTRLLLATSGAAILAGGWELAAGPLPLAPSSLPPLSQVVVELAAQVTTGEFWLSVSQTLRSALLGLAVALLVGVPVGLLVGLSDTAYRSTRFVLEFLKPIPAVVLVPLFLLILGPSPSMAVTLVAFGLVWVAIIQTSAGVRSVDPVAVETARAYQLSTPRRLWSVVVPAASPFIATGVRIAASSALVIAIVAELIAGAPGIGHEIFIAQQGGLYEVTYALVLATGLLGVAFNAIAHLTERRLLFWHESHRPEVA